MTALALAEATAALHEARRHHFLNQHDAGTAHLTRAAANLQSAIQALRGQPVTSEVREAAACFRRELAITLASHQNAEGWQRHWLSSIQSAAGQDTSYTSAGGLPTPSSPFHIAIEG